MLTGPTRKLRNPRRQSSQQADDVFQAVADPTRRALLDLLAEGEEPVNSLAERFAMSRPAISQHLAILLRTRLVRARRVGRERRYRLQPQPLEEIYEWVGLYERFWAGKLGALGEHLRKNS
ncbi:MAG: metalloregulator ArsR/SmtB family transcription factor [Terracidiphilus sp.]